MDELFKTRIEEGLQKIFESLSKESINRLDKVPKRIGRLKQNIHPYKGIMTLK